MGPNPTPMMLQKKVALEGLVTCLADFLKKRFSAFKFGMIILGQNKVINCHVLQS